MNGDVKAFGPESLRQAQAGFGRQINIKHSRTNIAIKMAVLRHVGTKASRSTIERHLPDQTAPDERVQAIIDRGHGDVGSGILGPDKHLFRGRVITLAKQNGINLLALRCETKTAGRQPIAQTIFDFRFRSRFHDTESVGFGKRTVNIWNNSKF